jgi:hypothetical protein
MNPEALISDCLLGGLRPMLPSPRDLQLIETQAQSCSATSRLSFAFSLSNSFNRLAWSSFSPQHSFR